MLARPNRPPPRARDRGALPVKLCYAGPFFRYERPQAGRYRQMQQVGVEAIGVDDPALDAEVIAVADAGFRSLGLDGFRLEVTSLGDNTCRPQYRELLQEFLFQLDLDDETRNQHYEDLKEKIGYHHWLESGLDPSAGHGELPGGLLRGQCVGDVHA